MGAESTETFSYYTISVVLAVLLIILSSWYTLRNILRLWTIGKPLPVDDEDETEEQLEQDDNDEVRPLSDIDSSGKEGGDWVKVGASDAEVDPVQFCEHIQSEVKKAKQKVAVRQVQDNLSERELEEENNVQRKQLEQIFKLMEEQTQFGVDSLDDVQQQMKLYA